MTLQDLAYSYSCERGEEIDALTAAVDFLTGEGYLKLVIQGENDRFGNAQAVKDEL